MLLHCPTHPDALHSLMEPMRDLLHALQVRRQTIHILPQESPKILKKTPTQKHRKRETGSRQFSGFFFAWGFLGILGILGIFGDFWHFAGLEVRKRLPACPELLLLTGAGRPQSPQSLQQAASWSGKKAGSESEKPKKRRKRSGTGQGPLQLKKMHFSGV